MRRWSKEPRRMSVVEGRVVASLARALSVCFIYQYETINRGSCQEFFKHFYEILFFSIFGARLPPTESVRDGTDAARLSARRTSVRKIRRSRQDAKNAKPPRFLCVPCALARYDFSPLNDLPLLSESELIIWKARSHFLQKIFCSAPNRVARRADQQRAVCQPDRIARAESSSTRPTLRLAGKPHPERRSSLSLV